MKWIFLYATLFTFICCSNEAAESNTADLQIENQSPSIAGKWKKMAYGPDNNKNGILDDNEKEKKPEAGGYEQLTFDKDGKFTVSGILGDRKGTYEVKNTGGKKSIHLYTDGDKEASKEMFQIISAEPKKLTLVPPIYLFMLVVYERVE